MLGNKVSQTAQGKNKRTGSKSTPDTFPWIGRVASWSVALRAQPKKNPSDSYQGILADLPRDTQVTVLSRNAGWLYVEATIGNKQRKGYVSRELIEYVSSNVARRPGSELADALWKTADQKKAFIYESVISAGDWEGAATQLNDFKDADILTLLKKRSATDLAHLMQGALLALPASHQRVTGPISGLSPFAAAVGTRLAAARKKLDAVRSAQFHVDVVPREGWGARPPDKSQGWDEYPKNAPLPLNRIIVHHTADPLKQTAKQLQDKEMDAGYSDMPYHFVITADGKIHEGRVMSAVGAHAGEFKGNKDIKKDPDYGAIGIVVTGDFESRKENFWSPDKPTAQQLKSLKQLIQYLLWNYKIAPSQVLKHSEVKRDGKPKVCPGEHLSPQVDASKLAAQQALAEFRAAEETLQAVEKEAAKLK